MADNRCATCEHKKYPDGGHCYMFREEPTFLCMQHQDRRGTEVRVGAALAVALATGETSDGVQACEVLSKEKTK